MLQLNKKAVIIALLATAMVYAETSARMKKDKDGITTRNLRILPNNISHEQLIDIMKHFSSSLGVKCSYCHVAKKGELTSEGKPVYDFASDDLHHKRIARKMMRLVQETNEDLDDIGDRHFERISCITYHRGNTQPSMSLDSANRARARSAVQD
jgi:hypothetical protein